MSIRTGRNLTFWGGIAAIEATMPGLVSFVSEDAERFLVQRRLTLSLPPGPSGGSVWMKWLNFTITDVGLLVMQVENRAVDAVPYDSATDSFYLIKRSDSELLSLPGGFIDSADGLDAGVGIAQITAGAAARELEEETGATADRMVPLGPPLLEVIAPGVTATRREWLTRTWPYAAVMARQELTPADDAQQAPGDGSGPPGWYRLDRPLPDGFHFQHHRTILGRLLANRAMGDGLDQSFPKLFKGREVWAARKLSSAVKSATLHDYYRLLEGREALLPEEGPLNAVDIARLRKVSGGELH